MRDSRINTIIEGTSQIMRLFIAREALDPHARRILPLLSSGVSLPAKLKLVLGMVLYYATWYPKQWFFWSHTKVAHQFPVKLRRHVTFVNKMSRQLARDLFHAMMIYQQGLEKRQRLLGRIVNIGTDLFAMAASCSWAALLVSKHPSDGTPIDLANLFCRDARKRVRGHFRTLFRNHDAYAYQIARKALEGKYNWLEQGIIPPT